MIYPFACECGWQEDVIRPAKEAGQPHSCPKCGNEMRRMWVVPYTTVKAHGYFNHGLNCFVRNAQDVRDAVKRRRDATGENLVEVGNEYAASKRKPIAGQYNFSEPQMRDMVNTIAEGQRNATD